MALRSRCRTLCASSGPSHDSAQRKIAIHAFSVRKKVGRKPVNPKKSQKLVFSFEATKTYVDVVDCIWFKKIMLFERYWNIILSSIHIWYRINMYDHAVGKPMTSHLPNYRRDAVVPGPGTVPRTLQFPKNARTWHCLVRLVPGVKGPGNAIPQRPSYPGGGGFNQPIWKNMQPSNWTISSGVNMKSIWNHHLDIYHHFWFQYMAFIRFIRRFAKNCPPLTKRGELPIHV